MTSLTRPSRSPSTRSNHPRTRVMLVRQPVRSVRSSDQPGEGVPAQFSIGAMTIVGALGLVWMIGYLGYQLGFAPLMNVPQLADNPVRGLGAGAMILVSVPSMILAAGLSNPEWLMVAFAMIAIPAAALGAARPRTPGGPAPAPVVVVFGSLGAVTAALSGVALIWWIASPMRGGLLRELPLGPAEAAQWAADLKIVAGLDVLALIVASLWLILVTRLPIPMWLRAITMTFSAFVLVVTTVGMSVSNAAASQVYARRSVCVDETNENNPDQLLLGSTSHRHVMLEVRDNMNLIELTSADQPLTVVGAQSIVEFLEGNEK